MPRSYNLTQFKAQTFFCKINVLLKSHMIFTLIFFLSRSWNYVNFLWNINLSKTMSFLFLRYQYKKDRIDNSESGLISQNFYQSFISCSKTHSIFFTVTISTKPNGYYYRTREVRKIFQSQKIDNCEKLLSIVNFIKFMCILLW